MKIALNCAFYQPKGGGIKEYIHNLVSNLAVLPHEHEIVLYVLKDQLDYAQENLPDSFRIKTIPFNSGSKLRRIKRSLLESKFWEKEQKREKFDLFHSPFFHAPKLKNIPVLLTVHDLRLYRFPNTYEFFRYQFLKRKVKKSVRRADRIISISDFTARELTELCGVPQNKITVIHEAIDEKKFGSAPDTIPDSLPKVLQNSPYILSVGHMEPRKNYDRLIEAFLNLKSKIRFKDLQLVIVGKKDHSFKKTLQTLEERPDMHYLNFVSGAALYWLYKNAKLFVFPSIYEGFGFPPLEAAASGTISAVSNISSIPEVCGDGAIYFDPYDVNDMTRAIREGLIDEELREDIRRKAAKRLSELSWLENARATLEIYNKMDK